MSLTDSQVQLNQHCFDLPDRILAVNEADLYQQLNRNSFMFTHNLAEHPLFQIPRLVELASHLITYGPGSIRCQVSGIPMNLKWTDVKLKEQFQEQLPDFIANIEKSDSWLLLYKAQRDPAYKALLDQIVNELEKLVDFPLRQEITWLDAYIFIASPHSITPYHIDHDSTLLFQMHGERESNLFDPYDRSVLTEQELENFYIGDLDAANYRDENQQKANVYSLIPGRGVHHPVCAPHWYKNGSSYSIALGIHFSLRSFDLKARVYQVNHYLRKFGLKPTPFGQSPFRDQVKIATLGLFTKRKPEHKLEIFQSGILRMTAPLRFASRMVKRLKR